MANNLSGLDMVAAITQNTINYQLQQLWRSGVIPRTLTMQEGKKSLNLTAMGAPTVDLNPAGGNVRRALLLLQCTAGTFTYWDDSQGDPVLTTVPVDNLVLAFDVDLDIELVSRSDLAAVQDQATSGGDGSGFDLVESVSNFSEELFSISRLFMDFENLNVSSWDQSRSKLGSLSPTAATALANFLVVHLTSLEGTSNPYVLGYSVTAVDAAKLPAEQALLAPTSATYSVTATGPGTQSPANPGLNTLNFLMMAGGRPLPTASSTGVFDFAFVASEDVYGSFVVDAGVFRREYVEALALPAVVQALGLAGQGSFEAKDPGWDLDVHGPTKTKNHKDASLDSVDVKETDESETRCVATLVAAPSPAILCKGYFYNKASYVAKPFWGTYHAYTSVKLNWTLTLELSAGDGGELVIKATLTQDGSPEVKSHKDDYFKGSDWFSTLFGNSTSDLMGSATRSFENIQLDEFDQLNTGTAAAFSSLQTQVILPAGQTFFYKDLAFDPANNLWLHVTYQEG